MISPAIHQPAQGHEPENTRVRLLLYITAGLVITVAIVEVLILLFQGYLFKHNPVEHEFTPSHLEGFSSAQNWTNPREDLAQLRQREDDHLNTYGWIDEKAGIAHIPIARAMELYAQQAAPPPIRNPQSEIRNPK